jgi:hypothetical protein
MGTRIHLHSFHFITLACVLTISILLSACWGQPSPPTNTQVIPPAQPQPAQLQAVVQVIRSNNPPVKREVSTVDYPQYNCGSAGATSYVFERSRTIAHTVALGGNVSVNASGEVGVPGVGNVKVGAEIAATYGLTYGQEETNSRALTLNAREGTNVNHKIRQVEYWQTGEAIVLVSNQEMGRYPYEFRTDFDIELVETIDLGCASSPPTDIPPPPPTPERTFAEKVSGSYNLISWDEAAGPITLWMDVLAGTLNIDQTGNASWELAIQERGEPTTPQPRIQCRGSVRFSSQQMEGEPGTGNVQRDWTSDIRSIEESVWLSFCGWTISREQGDIREPFTLYIEDLGNGQSLLEMRNAKGTFTWSK